MAWGAPSGSVRVTPPHIFARRSMAKPELGTKRVCVSCGAKFYDLMKTPAVCPKCDTEQPPEQPRMRRGGNVADDKRRAKPVPVPGAVDPDVEVDAADEEVDEDVLEDTSDLEDGDDAIVEVEVEVEGNEEER
jgi:uncharacterized protein (TIGR02300 family)